MSKPKGRYYLLTLVCLARAQVTWPFCSLVPTQINLNGAHSCVILEDSTTKCWGENAHGHLGLEDERARGGQPGEMGANLPVVNLGTGRTAVQLSAGRQHRCAILDNGDTKCWGHGEGGALGYGDENKRGDAAGEMGDNLPAVDLGTGLKAVMIASGEMHTCALLNNAKVKCWGKGGEGQRGSETRLNAGAAPNQMGDNLPIVDLGTGYTAIGVTCGDYHTCVLLQGGSVKCFGDNQYGQCGYSFKDRLGDDVGTMGANLPNVNVGTGAVVTKVSAGKYHTCVLLSTQGVKCFGYGLFGQLGYESTANKGYPNAADMGDALPVVNVGTGRKVVDMEVGSLGTCCILDDGNLKCWGANEKGQLGLESTSTSIGSLVGEMGDNLPNVKVGTGRKVLLVSLGDDHACAVLDSKYTKCWGSNSKGQLGLENMVSKGTAVGSMGDNLSPINLTPTPCPTSTTSTSTTTVTTSSSTTLTTTTSSSTSTITTSTSTSSSTVTTTSSSSTTSFTTSSSTSSTSRTSSSSSSTTTSSSTRTTSSSSSTTGTSTSSTTSMTTTMTPYICTLFAPTGRGLGLSVGQYERNGPIVVTALEAGALASEQGMVVGDIFYAVGGKPVSAMMWSEMQMALGDKSSDRVIDYQRMFPCPTTTTTTTTMTNTTVTTTSVTTTATVTKGPSICLFVAGQGVGLGLSLGQMVANGPILITALESGGWAEVKGVLLNDELVQVNDAAVATMAWSNLQAALFSKDPRALRFKRNGDCPTTTTTTSTPTLPPDQFRVCADASVTDLGLSMTATPPAAGPPVCSSVVNGQWAQTSGINPGNELVSLNDMPVANMSADAFTALLAKRTICMVWRNVTTTFTSTFTTQGISNCPFVAEQDVQLGLSLTQAYLNAPIVVLSKDGGGWADYKGVLVGDELFSVNGVPVSTMSWSGLNTILAGSAPRTLVFKRLGPCPPTTTTTLPLPPDQYRVCAGPGVADLGLNMSGTPPDPGPPVCSNVWPGMWAQNVGIIPGNELVSLNDRPVLNMSSDAFAALLMTRTICMVWRNVTTTTTMTPPLTTMMASSVCPMVVPAGVGMGVKLTQAMAGGPILVASVEAGGWAEISGITVGDELMSYNNIVANSVPWETLRSVLSSQDARTVNFGRLGNCPTSTTPSLLKTVTADPDTKDLGVTFTGQPPGPVTSSVVSPNSWGDNNGLNPGDELLTVNGKPVKDMSPEELKNALASRPLTMTFRASTTTTTSTSDLYSLTVGPNDPADLGVGFSGAPPGDVTATFVKPNSWGDKNGVSPGDQLLSVNGKPISDMTPEDLAKALQNRPFTATFRKTSTTTTSTTWDPWDLGFTLYGQPPDPLYCNYVRPNSWAEKQGIGVGDILVAINGRNCSDMTPQQLEVALKSRPLNMFWQKLTTFTKTTTTGCPRYTVNVDKEANPLHMWGVVDGWPPFIVSVEPNSPAANQGVTAGDVLVTVNGKKVADMKPSDLGNILLLSQTGPLALQLCPGPPRESLLFPSYARAADTDLGLTLTGKAPGEVRAFAVRPDSWADKQGITVGDELVQVNGFPVSALTADQLQNMLDTKRPLQLVWKKRDPPDWWYKTTSLPYTGPTTTKNSDCIYTVTAPRKEWVLGWSPDAFPPNPVKVMIVERGLWAERYGVQVGDTLLAINGTSVTGLDPLVMLDVLQNSRPLQLTFRCGSGPGRPPPGGWPGHLAPSDWPNKQIPVDPSTTPPMGEALLDAARGGSWQLAVLAALLMVLG